MQKPEKIMGFVFVTLLSQTKFKLVRTEFMVYNLKVEEPFLAG